MAPGANKQKLRAEDVEDLAVMAALMQDSVTRIADMAYDKNERTFMLAAQRYRREAHGLDGYWTQTSSALVFGCIQNVHYRGIIGDDPQSDLRLMTIATEPGDDTLYRIALLFEGGGEIRLTSDCLHCRMEDFGEVTECKDLPADHFVPDDDGDRLAPNS